jgi:hypothetical protein
MWRRVDLLWTDVSEKRIASTVRVEKSASEEPEWAGGSKFTDGGEVVSLTSRPPFTSRKIPGTHFCQSLTQTQSLIAAGRIRSIEKSNYLIGNRIRDLPAWSIVPQTTTLPCAPFHLILGGAINLWLYKENNKLRDWKYVFTLHIPPERHTLMTSLFQLL